MKFMLIGGGEIGRGMVLLIVLLIHIMIMLKIFIKILAVRLCI